MEQITQKDLLNYKFLSAVRYAPGGTTREPAERVKPMDSTSLFSAAEK